MIKLYKREPGSICYWEAWDAEGKVVVHWGRLGTRGATREIPLADGVSADDVIATESRAPRTDGFEEISIDEHATITVQFRVDDWGSSEDLEKRHAVEDIINECLGWTGNGHCDGGDIGSGTINVYSFAIDPILAKDAIVAALQEAKLLEGAVVAAHRDEEEDIVLWPKDFRGEFSLFYD